MTSVFPNIRRLLLAMTVCLPAPATAIELAELIARHIEARGGYAAIKAIDTVVYSEGTYSEAGYHSDGRAYMALARPFLKVVGNPGEAGNYREGYDGSAWEWFADPGIVLRTVGPANAAIRHGADLEGPLLDAEEKGNQVELIGEARVGDRPAWQLRVTRRDGFSQDLFLDGETYLEIAQRATAPFHAFGEAVTTETRVGDHRRVGGVLFAHRYVATVIATGEAQSAMQWGRIEVNLALPDEWFSPPEFELSPEARFLQHLYVQRSDPASVLWTYAEFRRNRPALVSADGVAFIGFQILKMDAHDAAVALLEANRRDHADAAVAEFALGRAYATTGRREDAIARFKAALAIDPDHERARRALAGLASGTSPDQDLP